MDTRSVRRVILALFVVVLLLVGCSTSEAPSGDDPLGGNGLHGNTTSSITGPRDDTHGLLRPLQLRRLLLQEDEIFVRSQGVHTEFAEGFPLMQWWERRQSAEARGFTGENAEACAHAVENLTSHIEETPKQSLMMVHAVPEEGEDQAAEVAIGMTSYRTIAQEVSFWKQAGIACDGSRFQDGVDPDWALHHFVHAGFHGVRMVREDADAEYFLAGFEHGHNSVTFYVSDSEESFVTTLIDRQKSKLGVP